MGDLPSLVGYKVNLLLKSKERKGDKDQMLLSSNVSKVESLRIELTFDNEQKKVSEIAVGDLVQMEYSDRGIRRKIEGKIVKISTGDHVNVSSWYIVVDGSLMCEHHMARVSPNQILDLDVIQKRNTLQPITTPNTAGRIDMIQFLDGYLQISLDGGFSWIKVGQQITNCPIEPGPSIPLLPEEITETLVTVKQDLSVLSTEVSSLKEKVQWYHFDNNDQTTTP